MSKRYAVLYSDGSLNVGTEQDDIIAGKKRLGFVKSDEDSKFVEVEIKVIKVIDADNKLKVVRANSVRCSCCGTLNEVPEEIDQEALRERFAP